MPSCKTCAQEIIFIKQDEKWKPLNLDGSPHYTKCKPKMGGIRATQAELDAQREMVFKLINPKNLQI